MPEPLLDPVWAQYCIPACDQLATPVPLQLVDIVAQRNSSSILERLWVCSYTGTLWSAACTCYQSPALFFEPGESTPKDTGVSSLLASLHGRLITIWEHTIVLPFQPIDKYPLIFIAYHLILSYLIFHTDHSFLLTHRYSIICQSSHYQFHHCDIIYLAYLFYHLLNKPRFLASR